MCVRPFKLRVLVFKILFLLLAAICITVLSADLPMFRPSHEKTSRRVFSVGDCKWVVDEACPDENIKFFLYNNPYPNYSQPIKVGPTPNDSNIKNTWFKHDKPVKIIIHGYNSDMNLSALQEIRTQYLTKYDYNIFAVDWSVLCPGPCYPSAVHNTKHVGECIAQLVDRIRDLNVEDIHVIGFSLGAHVTNYVANTLRPYKLPRITGLDPAMPGFTFVTTDNKLDETDAKFVDVIHTNAFIQGKIEPCGHVDFYMNGGVIQPGCWAENRFFACNHHRAPLYFAESITTEKGFWGWPCSNYFMYLIGQCPPVEPQILMGAFVNTTSKGLHLVITGSVSPYAVGKFSGPSIEIFKINEQQRRMTMRKVKNFELRRNLFKQFDGITGNDVNDFTVRAN